MKKLTIFAGTLFIASSLFAMQESAQIPSPSLEQESPYEEIRKQISTVKIDLTDEPELPICADPRKWSVEQTYQWALGIIHLNHAKILRRHEIDVRALLYITPSDFEAIGIPAHYLKKLTDVISGELIIENKLKVTKVIINH